MIAEVVERHGEALDDLGREACVLVQLDEVRVLQPDLIDLLVLVLVEVAQVFVLH
jgi:hypothetical protein